MPRSVHRQFFIAATWQFTLSLSKVFTLSLSKVFTLSLSKVFTLSLSKGTLVLWVNLRSVPVNIFEFTR
ncbi:MAG: hypothetical protein LH478_04290 [Chitinophagaceae bacterium]|nr:hypothetical protein [Chitinophagaceae bacterium]